MYRPGRLDDLFVRYWDDALTDAEAADLAGLLRDDPAARAQFQVLCVQTVAAGDGARVPVAHEVEAAPRKWTRRRMLGFAGLAVGAAAVGVGVSLSPGGRRQAAVLTKTTGRVLVRSELVSLGSLVLPGDTLAVEGVGSSATMECPDGSEVVLTGNTVATLDTGNICRLTIHQGGVSADLTGRGPHPLTLATREAAMLTGTARAMLTLGRFGRQTEVGVLEGKVQVTRPEGQPLVEVAGGEVGTVTPGSVRKEARPALPTEYAWDLTRPLPPGWTAGRPVQTPDGPALRAEWWGDKYAEDSFQVRAVNGWTNGLAWLHPDSIWRFKYRVERPGKVQAYVVLRPDPSHGPEAGVLYVEKYTTVDSGDWKVVEVRAADLAPGQDCGPRFGPPWVLFIVAFNTFNLDLGLQVAECRITRPGSSAPR